MLDKTVIRLVRACTSRVRQQLLSSTMACEERHS
jgi:hypothetical protein